MKINLKGTALGILGAVILALIIALYMQGNSGAGETSIQKIDEWNRSVYGQEIQKITLPEKVFRKDGETVKIHTYLPEGFIENQTIGFWTYYQDVEVYLDEELLYTNVSENGRFGKASYSQWNYVDIPDESQGKKLLICLKCPYKNYEFQLDEVVFGSQNEIHQWIAATHGMNQILDYLLMGVGVLFVIFSILQKRNLRYRACQFFFGLLGVLIGVWMRTSTKGISLYWMPLFERQLFGEVSFLLIPIALICYVRMRSVRIKRLKQISDGMIFINALFVIVSLGLQLAGIRDIRELIVVAEIWFLIAAVWAVVVAAYYYMKEKESVSEITVISAYLLVVAIAGAYMNYVNISIPYFHPDKIFRICVVAILLLEMTVFMQQLRHKEYELQQKEKVNKNLQINMLTNHIRPHFILNTLGAIRSTIRRDPNKAYDLLYDFSKYIRKNMEEKDYSKKVPFMEEMDYIQTYLKLEKIRFEERIQVVYDIQVRDFWILPLTIQPFVENAVKHGLLEKQEGGVVKISTIEEDKYIVIKVEDDGVGFDTDIFWKEVEHTKSIGLKSSIIRLQNEMHAICKLTSNTTEGQSGTYIEVRIPKKDVAKDENNNRR